jgi:Ion transport protein
MYNSVSVPYEASFRYIKTALQDHIESVIDVLFALDVCITFRTAYINDQSVMVRDGGKIVKNYVKTWFPIDLLASLPLDSIVLLFGSGGNANLTYFALLKVWPCIARSRPVSPSMLQRRKSCQSGKLSNHTYSCRG